MDDIRLNGNDGDYLILETADGEQYRLVNDESLQSAVKKAATASASDSMSPRAMQDAVRNGASIAEVVEASGASYEFVEKFAAPVLAELAHVIDSAKTLRLPGLSETGDVEFGDFVTSKLSTLHASDARWSAKRLDFNLWHISVNYSVDGSEIVAIWSFDPKRLVLSPENDKAVNIGRRDTAPAAFLGGLVSASTIQPANDTVKLTLVEAVSPSPVAEEPASSDVNHSEGIAVDELVATSETYEETDGNVAADSAPLSATADLLQALRKKRAESVAAEQTITAPIDIAVSSPEPVNPTEQPGHQETIEPAAKKGRPSMPSWDQIVFGTKADD